MLNHVWAFIQVTICLLMLLCAGIVICFTVSIKRFIYLANKKSEGAIRRTHKFLGLNGYVIMVKAACWSVCVHTANHTEFALDDGYRFVAFAWVSYAWNFAIVVVFHFNFLFMRTFQFNPLQAMLQTHTFIETFTRPMVSLRFLFFFDPRSSQSRHLSILYSLCLSFT